MIGQKNSRSLAEPRPFCAALCDVTQAGVENEINGLAVKRHTLHLLNLFGTAPGQGKVNYGTRTGRIIKENMHILWGKVQVRVGQVNTLERPALQ